MHQQPTYLIEANELAAALDRFTAALADLASRVESGARDAYTLVEAGERLGVGKGTVRGLVDRGELRKVPAGGTDLIPASEIHRFLASAEQPELRDTA